MKRILIHSFFVAAIVAFAGCSIKPVEVLDADGPDQLTTNESGTFEAQVNEGATDPVSGMWDFGDGSSASGMAAEHAYSQAGTYTVTFTASNQKRRKSTTDSESFTVVVEDPIMAPSIVSVTTEPSTPDTRSAVEFIANVRDDSREETVYAWDFGDGGSSSQARPRHIFETEGTYSVQLRVSNSAGQDARTSTVTVVPYEAAICRDLTELNGAFFDRNSSTLKPEARQALQENLEILTECANICVTVSGFSVPGERNAQRLSEARARAVEQFYTEGGVAASRIQTEGRGRVSGVSTKDGLSQFRRADTVPGDCSM